MTHEPWIAQLDRYLDGELELAAMQSLDQHLRECPACAAESLRRLQWRRMVQSAGKRFSPDSVLRERVRKSMAAKPLRQFSWRWSAVAAVMAVFLAAAGWVIVLQQKRAAQQNYILGELADLHVGTMASASPVDVVSTDRHTVKPWFEGKIPFSFNLPELQGSGFELVGGRVSYLEQAPGAELVYRIRKHQISVFIFQDRAIGGVSAIESGNARTFRLESWKQGELRYFEIGDAGAEDLRGLRELLSRAN